MPLLGESQEKPAVKRTQFSVLEDDAKKLKI
jgi:hypothetical protein